MKINLLLSGRKNIVFVNPNGDWSAQKTVICAPSSQCSKTTFFVQKIKHLNLDFHAKKSTIFLEILLSLNFKDTTCHFRPLCYVVKLSREHIQGSGEEKWEAYNYQSRFRNEQSVGLSNVFIRFLHTWHYFLLIESMWFQVMKHLLKKGSIIFQLRSNS